MPSVAIEMLLREVDDMLQMVYYKSRFINGSHARGLELSMSMMRT
jgi:hypothetical protein